MEAQVEAQLDMSELGHAPPFTPDQGSEIEERFLAFLRGFKVNDQQFYKIISSALAAINLGELSIRYAHLQQFDPILANTIHIFFGSVQTNLANAAKIFLKEDVGFQCENPAVKISDRPMPCSFMPLKDFWSSPEHHPSEECDIYCGEMVLTITKTTSDGRIILLNLLRKIFGSFGKGNSWNGDWTIADVMVCLKTYQVEIIKPFFKNCNYSTMRRDILVISTSIIPEFECGGRFPAFFGHLESSLRMPIIESDLSALTWKKFCGFITSHFALKLPLTRSKFLDNLHEMCPGAKKLLQAILSNRSLAADWRFFLKDEDVLNPVLAIVYEHNRKHKDKLAQERKTTGEAGKSRDAKKEDNTSVVVQTNVLAEIEHTFDANAEMQALDVGVMQTNNAEVEDLNAGLVQTLVAPFEGTLEGLLIFSRHLKQHASKASKDNNGEQRLQELSEIDLVISHYLETLPEVLKALIYNIDSEHLKCYAGDYDKFMVMFREIFEVYNAPEIAPNSEAEMETFLFLADSKNLIS